MMWRYLVGGVAALLLAAAGIFFFRGSASPTGQQLAAAPAPKAGATAAPLPSAAPEATERSREERRFDRLDKDRDQTINAGEYFASRQKAFAKLDADHDGKLSFEEWAIRARARFGDADADHSNTLTRAEFATTAPKPRAQRPKCVCQSPAPEKDASDEE